MPAGSRRAGSAAGRTQRGVALLVVLWACTLLAILLGGFAALARTEATQTRYLSSRVQLRYLAEAGVMRALAEITASNGGRWRGDGRPYAVRIDGRQVDVRIVDDAGKVDINTAKPEILAALFAAAGVGASRARQLADNVREWRDPAGAFNRAEGAQRYANAGLEQGPRYGEFAVPDELQSVLGMTPALYRKLSPVLTVWSRREVPAAAFAPPLALAALPGMDAASAATYAQRRAATPGSAPPPLPNGMPLGNTRGSSVRTVIAVAQDAEGVRMRLNVTVRLERLRTGTSYSILRWQEDGAE